MSIHTQLAGRFSMIDFMSACRSYSLFIVGATLLAGPRERHFSFEYRATVPATAAGNSFHLWVPIPHDDDYQHIANLRIESSAPYRVGTDELGNQILSIESGKRPSITVKFDC